MKLKDNAIAKLDFGQTIYVVDKDSVEECKFCGVDYHEVYLRYEDGTVSKQHMMYDREVFTDKDEALACLKTKRIEALTKENKNLAERVKEFEAYLDENNKELELLKAS